MDTDVGGALVVRADSRTSAHGRDQRRPQRSGVRVAAGPMGCVVPLVAARVGMMGLRGRREADDLYGKAAAEFGGALERLARGYEADSDRRRDLLQEIHVALW